MVAAEAVFRLRYDPGEDFGAEEAADIQIPGSSLECITRG